MNYELRITNRKSGQAMLLATIFFLFISLTIIFGMVVPVVNHIKQVTLSNNSKQSYILAEALNEDILYRLNHAQNVPSSVTLSLNGGTATATVTSNGTTRQVLSQGITGKTNRSVSTTFTQGAGVAFNYGLQAGNGGIIADASTIKGNVYSNGDIDAKDVTITGTAVAADSAAITADQTNVVPLPPPNSISFGNTASTQDFAQSFELSTTSVINKFQFYIKKNGSPSNATIRIAVDNNGSPDNTTFPIGSVSLNAGLVTGSYGWVEVVIPTSPSLVENTPYWIIIDNGSTNAGNYYIIGANSAYATGVAKTGAYNGSWNATGFDGYFKVYTGGITSTIGRASYSTSVLVGSSTSRIGDAWAYNVKGTTAYGKIYCTTGSNNNQACDTSKGSPSPQPFPFSDSNIQSWKDDAEAGGIITGSTNCHGGYASGNCTVDYAGATFGPGKITGNLTVNGGGTLTLTGPLWVEGAVNITNGGKVVLPSNYAQNSEVIVSDNTITVSGGGSAGSGNSHSYLFMVSTSLCPYDSGCLGKSAVTVSGGASTIAVNAQSGGIALSGSANIKAAVGNSMIISGGSTVTYDSGLASPSFQSGPSGAWNIQSWQEVP